MCFLESSRSQRVPISMSNSSTGVVGRTKAVIIHMLAFVFDCKALAGFGKLTATQTTATHQNVAANATRTQSLQSCTNDFMSRSFATGMCISKF